MLIYCDGLTEPENNGGPNSKGTWAFLVLDDKREGGPVVIHKDHGYEGTHQTNNRMEYLAVGHAVRWAVDNCGGETVRILTDSQLVVKQVNGEWSINAPHLKLLCDRIIALIYQYNSKGGEIEIGWVKGTENKADELTRLAYQVATGVYPQPRVRPEKTENICKKYL